MNPLWNHIEADEILMIRFPHECLVLCFVCELNNFNAFSDKYSWRKFNRVSMDLKNEDGKMKRTKNRRKISPRKKNPKCCRSIENVFLPKGNRRADAVSPKVTKWKSPPQTRFRVPSLELKIRQAEIRTLSESQRYENGIVARKLSLLLLEWQIQKICETFSVKVLVVI